MTVQPQLVLLQKTLLNIEGLGRDLYPELDLWVTAKPFFEKWARENNSVSAFLRKISKNSPKLINELSELPDTLSLFRKQLQDNEVRKEINNLKSEIKDSKIKNAILLVIIFSMVLFEFSQ